MQSTEGRYSLDTVAYNGNKYTLTILESREQEVQKFLEDHKWDRCKPYRHLFPAPASAPAHNKDAKTAIAIDCEFIGVMRDGKPNQSAVAQIVAVDLLTGKVLLNHYVQPDTKITHWRTPYGGPEPKEFKAFRRGRYFCIEDQNTVLIGHALQNDLQQLNIVHDRTLDTQRMISNIPGNYLQGKLVGLSNLCYGLGVASVQKTKAHDCLEDVYATREVLLYAIFNWDEVVSWATGEARKADSVEGSDTQGTGEDTIKDTIAATTAALDKFS